MDLTILHAKIEKIRDIYEVVYHQSRGYTDRDLIVLDEFYNLWRIDPWQLAPFQPEGTPPKTKVKATIINGSEPAVILDLETGILEAPRRARPVFNFLREVRQDEIVLVQQRPGFFGKIDYNRTLDKCRENDGVADPQEAPNE